MTGGEKGHFRFGEYELDAEHRSLMFDGAELNLNPKTFDLLVALIKRGGSVVSKDELLAEVWPDQFVEENNLSVHVSALRKALGERNAAGRFIATIPGRGYSFVAAVEALGNDRIVERRTVERITIEQDADETSAVRRLAGIRSSRWQIYALTLLIVTTALASLWLWKGARAAARIEAIAVLPFVYQGERADTDYLSDGVTESLINNLSRLPGLTVKARSSVFRFKGQDATPQSAGAQLGVQAVLLGRIVDNGDTLALNIEVVNATTGDQIWGQRYERPLTDIATLSNEIAIDVAGKLRLRLGVDPIARGQTKDSEAYELYLRGRYLWNKRTKPDHERALELFNQAIARDPNFALAYAAIGDVYGVDSSPLPEDQSQSLGRAAAMKALEIDPQLGEPHATLGNIDSQALKWELADQDYLRAIELNPGYPDAHHWRAETLTRMGRHDEAIAEMRTALLLDPFSQVFNNDYAYILLYARRYDEGLAQAKRSHELNKDWGTDLMVYALEYLDRYDEALDATVGHPFSGAKDAESIAAFSKQIEHVRDRLKLEGNIGYWRGWLEVLDKDIVENKPGDHYLFAAICSARIGQYDKALDMLEKAMDAHDGGISLSFAEPHFDSLREMPRYKALMRKLGFDPPA